MTKHFIALLILSLIVILATPYCNEALDLLLSAHQTAVRLFGHVFAGSHLGTLLQSLLALLVVPMLIGGLVAGIYWGIKRSKTPYLVPIIWVAWIVLATALVIQIS